MIRNPNCTLCELHKLAKTVCLMGVGPKHADIMAIGEAPGEEEDNEGEPFVGRAGDVLNTILETLEIPRATVYISNAVHCRPIMDTKNAKPTRKQIKICSSTYLTQEVASVKPKLIVAMGASAAEGILQQKVGVNQYRNRTWLTREPYIPKIPVIVTYHPAATFYSNGSEVLDAIVQDFERALVVLNKKEVVPELDYGIAKDPNAIYVNAVSKGSVALDLETEGFDPYIEGANIISAQTCSKAGRARYVRIS